MTSNPPKARLLDITRLMRRSGRVLTGVDRVELAYLHALMADAVPVFALARSRWGYLLLDEAGLAALSFDAPQSRIWRTARQAAIGRVPPPLLGRMIRRAGLAKAAYINVGHSNLTERVLRTLGQRCGLHIAVLIHDVIPLEHPAFQRQGMADRFADMLARVDRYADLILYNSQDTWHRTQPYLTRDIPSIVSHLGTKIAAPDPSFDPPPPPYFLCVGTIEPRKNHAFLLDLWQEMGPEAPKLVIVGARGWRNEAVFERLDALDENTPIIEMNGLSDGEVATLMDGARAVLMPSLAEGYGLPVVEAVARNVPVVANDLAVYRECAGDIPIYASVSDRYLWINTIMALAKQVPSDRAKTEFEVPDWDMHFKTVLRQT